MVIRDNPDRRLLQQATLSRRATHQKVGRITQKVVKGQALAEFLANHPCLLPKKTTEAVVLLASKATPDWILYFDGCCWIGLQGGVGRYGGEGMVLMEPGGQLHLHAYSLSYFCTNNSAEQEALLLGFTLAIELKVKHLLF